MAVFWKPDPHCLLLLLALSSAVLAALATLAPSFPGVDAPSFPGVDAFRAGEGGYACFRLPALLRLPSPDNRSLALYAEGRLKSCSDYAPIDLVYKISPDNGATLSNLSILCTDVTRSRSRRYSVLSVLGRGVLPTTALMTLPTATVPISRLLLPSLRVVSHLAT